MSTTNYDSRPRNDMLGIKDESGRAVPVENVQVPAHLPLSFNFAEKGPEDMRMILRGMGRRLYGDATFDETSIFCTHQTPFLNLFMEQNNPTMFMRLRPPKAKTAMCRFAIERITTSLPVYERDEFGAILYEYNEHNQPVPKVTGTVIGHRLIAHNKIIAPTGNDDFDPITELGQAKVIKDYREGSIAAANGEKLGFIEPDTTNPDGIVTKSTLYTLFDLPVSSFGKHGNNVGIRFELPHLNSTRPLDVNTFYREKSYNPRVGIVLRDTRSGWWNGVDNLKGETMQNVSFKPTARDATTNKPMYIASTFIKSFLDSGANSAELPPEFSKIHVYEDQLKELLTVLADGAPDGALGESETNDEALLHGRAPVTKQDMYVINFLGGFDETGAPYYNIETGSSALFGGVTVGANGSVIQSEGGDDGLFYTEAGIPDEVKNAELYDNLVRNIMEQFTNGPIPFTNRLRYPFSRIWDSGYSVETKRALTNIISSRKDTSVVLSTFTLYDYVAKLDQLTSKVTRVFTKLPLNDAATEISIGGMLRTYASAHPESEIYGTKTCRAIVTMMSVTMVNNDQYMNRVPLSYELARMTARFQGNMSGAWDPGMAYDINENRILSSVRDIRPSIHKDAIQDQAWANGIVYAIDYDMRRKFFPAIRTVYDDETSVLNSAITMEACTVIERMTDETWRELVGNSRFSPFKFLEESDRILKEKLNNKFDGRFIIVVNTNYTERDEILGYRWSTTIEIYSPNMKLVGTPTIISRRLSEYQAT